MSNQHHQHDDLSKDKNIKDKNIKEAYRDYELGIAGKLTKAFITSPLSIILFFAMLGAGIM
ncbi:MAG TPA: hypothetical protein EYQ04_04450, partial [Candidatus Thioglobus sp.]|nr:hypothetical protein [Candidatus Thioglobus sp.]